MKLLIMIITFIVAIFSAGIVHENGRTVRVINNNVDVAFNNRVEAITIDIQSNISSIVTELGLYSRGIHGILYADYVNSSHKLDNMQSLSRHVYESSRFNISEVVSVYIVNNLTGRDWILSEAKDIYDQPTMIIYDITSSGVVETPNSSLPITPMFNIFPRSNGPGLPVLGMPNILYVEPELNDIINFSADQWAITPFSNFINVLGQPLMRLNIFYRYYDTVSFIGFDPRLFLSQIVPSLPDKHVKVIVIDDHGVLYTNTHISTSASASASADSGSDKIEILSFQKYNWTIHYYKTDDLHREFSNDYILIISTLGSVFGVILIILTIVILHLNKKQLNALAELNLQKRVGIISRNSGHIMHEIRNTLTPSYTLLNSSQLIDIDQDMYNIIKNSVINSVMMTTNVLDFEQLCIGKYQSKPIETDIIQTIKDNMNNYKTKCVLKTSLSPHQDHKVVIDKHKYNEVFNNLFTNASTHTIDNIIVKIHIYNNYLVTQIYNDIDNFPSDRNLYIPFFIDAENDRDIWGDTLKLLDYDESIYNQIKHSFDLDTYVVFNNDIDRMPTNRPSTGMGLPITRLICKNLGGETGHEINSSESTVLFWFCIKLQETSPWPLSALEIQNNDDQNQSLSDVDVVESEV